MEYVLVCEGILNSSLLTACCKIVSVVLQVKDGAQCIFTTCPLHTCDEVVNEDVFRAILGVYGLQKTGGSGASSSPHIASSSGSSESKAGIQFAFEDISFDSHIPGWYCAGCRCTCRSGYGHAVAKV